MLFKETRVARRRVRAMRGRNKSKMGVEKKLGDKLKRKPLDH